ncbi:DUF6323 family protein [Anaerocolumna aminovalerica]|uniref:Uncharacterized protein n=2 Tax=Anaerocolumna aminovalerica TaxID=1527 RepID=A0A1I5BH40_9FIRM|nr:DUF6323 family protein [Anaerocolumna aminovalerica]MBU5331512.1 hypothetical protein [Anaerocolumna aminovalerica]SFN74035.1 hypothetical protein SAMN04489757_1018 [Anaerocolumna aminovalerica]
MEKDFFEMIVKQKQKEELDNVMLCNSSTEKFGVRLTEQDALQLLKSRISNLREQERIEFGEGILPKLIVAFCDSPYIYQDNYVPALEALQEIFYEYKNETLDELTDDELIEFMKEHFDGDCQGSIEYLEDTCLEKLARKIRYGYEE